MSTHDDDLGGYEDLSPAQRQLVNRYRNKARRHDHNTIEPTNRDRWARFQRVETEDEHRRFGPT